jgi:hypothetical protein
VDLVGNGGDQAAQEVPCGEARHLLMQLDKGELRRSVDGDDEVELALRSSNLGDVDMEIADRIGLEFASGGGFAFDLRQPGDPIALQTPVKSASDAGWWAVERRGSRRAAAKHAFGRRQRRPLPLPTGLSIWAPGVRSEDQKLTSATSTWRWSSD